MNLRNDIIQAGKRKGWDVYQKPFRPKDLGLKASDYGSFSDHAINGTTKSSKYNTDQCLKAVEFDKNGRPTKYILLP